MRQTAAKQAVRTMMGIHLQEVDRYARLDRDVRPPTDRELMEKYDIELGGRNFERQMQIARQSFNPTLQLLLDTYSQSLKVDNYFRSADEGALGDVSEGWEHWQRNRMDARQTGLHHAALKYGLSYAAALPADLSPQPVLSRPGSRGAMIETFNPKRLVTAYGEKWDWEEYPIMALQFVDNGFRLYDEEYVYFFGVNHKPESPSGWSDDFFLSNDNMEFIEKRAHGVGVTPIVRYRDKMMTSGEESRGMIDSLTGIASRIDTTNFQEGISRNWAAFKQRYVIGWMPKDQSDAFKMAASDTWFFKDSKTQVDVGQFDETDLGQYSNSRHDAQQDFASSGQLSATVMGAQAISNISAEGLAALEKGKESKSSELQTSLGESHEQLFRLCAHISGDSVGSSDFNAEVKWKDTTAKTMAQSVDALVKLATGLGVPVEELWPEIPGWSNQQVKRAQVKRQEEQDALLMMPLDVGVSSPTAGSQTVAADSESRTVAEEA